MYDFTINTDVLMMAGGQSNHGDQAVCEGLLNALERTDAVVVVLDKEGHMEQEYGNKMRPQSVGRLFLGIMAAAAKVRYVNRGTGECWSRLRKSLDDAHFDHDDHHVVRTAMMSEAKTIVTCESDYSAKVKKALWKLAGISVIDPAEALESLRANHCG